MQLQFNLAYINKESEKRLHRQQVKTTLAAGLKQGSRLFYIRDKNTGYLFLVDTGAQISVIPPDPRKSHQLSSFTLQAANGSRIETYGEIALLYSHMPYRNNTTIIKQTHDDKTQEGFFIKYFTSHLYL